MADNILYAGTEELKALRQRIEVQEQSTARVAELETEQLNLSKAIDAAKRAMNEEVDATVKERRAAVEASFEAQKNSLERDVKKIQSAKSKEKQEKVAAKVSTETVPYYDQIKGIKKNIKDYASEKKLPLLARLECFYTLFCPRTFGQVIIGFFAFLLCFLGVPFCLRVLLKETAFGQWEYSGDVIYVICILIFGAIFILINNKVRNKYREDIDHILDLRADIRATKRKIARVKKGIERDKDESQYGLENYDSELSNMENKQKEFTEAQNQALEEFNKVTRQKITDEICNRHEVEINKLQADFEDCTAELKTLSEKVRAEAFELTRDFEATLGKNNMKLEVVDRLIELIETGAAENVSQALVIVKNETSTK